MSDFVEYMALLKEVPPAQVNEAVGHFAYQGSPVALEQIGQREVALGDTPLERGYSFVLAQTMESAATVP